MKKIIYLLTIALIILCSCKGNSFMTQRYTNFGHNANKNTIAKKHTTKPEIPVVENIETKAIEYLETASVLETEPILFVKESLIKPIKENFEKANSITAKQETKEVKNFKTEFKSKKIVKKNSSMAQRIVGTLLKIILWIIILAVVVGIILIIGALA